MRLLSIFLLFLSLESSANVLELGTIDSRKGLLDQRYTFSFSEAERMASLGNFYMSKNNDFLAELRFKEIESGSRQELDQQWNSLLEVSHD